jgi:hypothetical protein
MRGQVSIKRVRMSKQLFTAAIVAALALPALAQGHDVGGPPDLDHMVRAGEVPGNVDRALGGDVTALPSGLYEVETPGGFTFTTHGPDPYAKDVAGSPLTPGAPERAPHCVDDPDTDYYQQVLYGYVHDLTNNLAANRAAIRAQIRRNNALINRDAQASGGPEADYDVLCDPDGQISVTAFDAGSSASFSSVVDHAQAAGFTNPRVDYSIFFDGNGSSFCGFGNIVLDEQPGVGNANNTGGDYGMTYRDCWFGRTSIHENAHNQGAAQPNAPNSTGTGWHCNELNDILCYTDGGSQNQTPIACPLGPPLGGGYYYDCNWNTYFDAAPEGGEWLSNHWNIGSPVNRFITFANATTPPETTIDSGVSGPTPDDSPDFAFSANDPASTFECSLQATGPPSFAACTSPQSYSGLADGSYEFQVRATDAANNVDPTPALDAFSLDTQPPDTSIDSGPSGAIATAKAQFAFSSNEAGSFECQLDGGSFAACASPSAIDVGQGPHTFAVRSIDLAGHADGSPATRSFSVDTVGPDTRLTKSPKSVVKSKHKPKLSFAFAASESGTAFECSLDSAPFSACSSPYTTKKLRFGKHVFAVRAVDALRNADASAASYSFKVKKKHKRH